MSSTANRIIPARADYRRLAAAGRPVPVWSELMADLETPVSAFLKLHDGRHGYLLESVEGGEKWGRYSFIGCGAMGLVRGRGGLLEVIEGGKVRRTIEGRDGLAALEELLAPWRMASPAGLPRFFGGAVGCLSYDSVRQFETLPDRHKPGLGHPDLLFLLASTMVIFDNAAQTLKIVSYANPGTGSPTRTAIDAAYDRAVARIQAAIRKLRRPLKGRPAWLRPLKSRQRPSARIVSTLDQPAFEKMVQRAKDYIAAGDILQVVLSQRFERPVRTAPFSVYRALRMINPSPYMYYLSFGDLQIAGSSPEVLVRCEEHTIEVRPIAGTRPRGRTVEEDQRLEAELRADEKERAEHIMLVDLGRNDVGRVSELGSVSIDALMTVERYSHVMHLVSHVTGRLAAGQSAVDVLRACFPAGTVSGAPKIRAMEIIEELEPTRRGLYAGAVGYLGFTGNLDAAINIRTILFDKRTACVQAGAGIVADSDPAKEYWETVHKAQGMMAAIDRAEAGEPGGL
jgi:anthranilate synthase component 1